MRRRTVLHLIDTGGPGGAETIFLKLATRLNPSRWKSVAVVPVKDWLWGALLEHGIEPILLPSSGSFDLSYLAGITRLIREHSVDLIQTHLFTSAVYASAAALTRRVPAVCTFHGQNDLPVSDRFYSVKKWLIRRRQNHFVFVSDRLREWFLQRSAVERDRSGVIHNGIDTQVFCPRPKNALRSELGASPEDFLVGAVGNLRRPKDYPIFLRAAAILAAKSDRYRFVIVGAGDEQISNELEVLRSELGLDQRLRFVGFRRDPELVMNSLDAYVLSSSTEGFSLTTTQAMASGIPVVATRSGGPEEILSDGRTGLLVDVGQPEAVAAAVEKLSLSADLRDSLAAAGLAHVREHFSIHAMVSKYETLYEKSLGTKDGSRPAADTEASVTAEVARRN